MFRCAASDLERGVRANLINSTPSKRIGHELFSPFLRTTYTRGIHTTTVREQRGLLETFRLPL